MRAIAALACLALGVIALDRICPPDLSRLRTQSLLLLDRDGKPLDAVLAPDGRWRLAATPADIDPLYLRLLLATEDRHFDIHPGVDPVALARAALQFAVRGRVVSGGSTLTMQVARLLMPHRRDMAGKLVEIARALQLEWRFGKWRILSMYLTLAPMGGNIEGVRAGALAWFGHGPGHLTAPEAALLVALPRSPARFRPDRHPKAAIKAAARVLDASALPSSDLEAPVRHPVPHAAYHLAERLGRRSGAVITTVDGGLQRAIDRLATAEPAADGGEIAVLVVRNADRAVLGYLGGHANGAAGGDVDMVRAVRSPGSTLKPFVYAMAIDAGLLRPDTLVDDAALQVGGWAPHDFDGGFRGTVTVREALQQSLNAPAVRVLDRVGPARFAAALRDAGAPLVLPPGAAASLPIVLGGAGIRLADLAMLYAGLADDGRAAPLRLLRDDPLPAPRPFIGAAAARAVGAILRAAPLPDGIGAPDRPVAFKTGTSFGFRDAWAAGFSPRYTVVLWTGRADGTPRPGLFGARAAAPLLFRIFDLLPPEPGDAPPPPQQEAPLGPSMLRLGGGVTARGPSIVYPPAGAAIEAAGAVTPIALEAAGGAPPYRWIADGLPLPRADGSTRATWRPAGPGFAHLTVIDRDGRTAGVDVEIE